ncbi:12358_t:CDS:2 [Ambispora gerdemannii]|uniref:12358_t:CDS:1 n=1 Tax=Ambispora gerdemannii TaxID=144530 RepID=A0A9N9CLE0_9GLOM|nr:12358_t:CDS:2 [Ambispora gerdemannii]
MAKTPSRRGGEIPCTVMSILHSDGTDMAGIDFKPKIDSRTQSKYDDDSNNDDDSEDITGLSFVFHCMLIFVGIVEVVL